jgi:hypothetical protein
MGMLLISQMSWVGGVTEGGVVGRGDDGARGLGGWAGAEVLGDGATGGFGGATAKCAFADGGFCERKWEARYWNVSGVCTWADMFSLTTCFVTAEGLATVARTATAWAGGDPRATLELASSKASCGQG